MEYKSARGIDLIVTYPPQRPTITVENYLKWYDLYLIDAQGARRYNYDEYADIAFPGTIWGDHVINPAFVRELCYRKGLDVDERAFEVIVGRWVMDCEGRFSEIT